MDKIAFITDLHTLENNVEKKGVDTVKNWKTVLSDLKSKGIEKIILGGDLVEKESLDMLFQDIQEFDYDFILGNHDSIKHYKDFEPKTDGKDEYFFTSQIEGWNAIFLDTSSYKLNKKQQEILEVWLLKVAKPVVFIHHPVVNIGSWMDKEHPLKNRDEVEQLINGIGKNITLICGHYHQMHEKSTEFIRQIIAPAVSYQNPYSPHYQKDTSTFGYLLLDFSQEKIGVEEIKFSSSHN